MTEINVTPPEGAGPPPRPARPGFLTSLKRRVSAFFEDHRVSLVIGLFAVSLFAVLFWRRIFIKIGPGEEGVIYRLFAGGTETAPGYTYKEGLRIIWPWDTMYIYNMRLQQVPDSFVVLSKDGLAVKVEVSIRFKPEPLQLGLLHKEIGPDYVEKVVKSTVQAEIRFVMGQYRPEEIYTSQGFIIQTAVKNASAGLASRYIVLDNLLLKSVTLPPTVAASIESKLRAQQLYLEYKYRLEAEAKEADRKRTEARGIRDFENLVSEPGLSDQYLRFKGIEATLELAKSLNPKTVIIGGGDDKMSLILDGAAQAPVPASLAPRK